MVRCERSRHLLRTVSSAEVGVKISCEDVTGDEFEHGGRSHLPARRSAHISDRIQVASMYFQRAFPAAGTDRALAVPKGLRSGSGLGLWGYSWHLIPQEGSGCATWCMCLLPRAGAERGLALGLTRFFFPLKAPWRSVHKQK